MIPLWLRKWVVFIMKDGDPQQRNEIIGSLKSIFPNASEGGCGYHLGEIFSYIMLPNIQSTSTHLTSS